MIIISEFIYARVDKVFLINLLIFKIYLNVDDLFFLSNDNKSKSFFDSKREKKV